MNNPLRGSLLAVALTTALPLSPALATNGYFTHGVGTHSKAMAGAGDAMPGMAIDVVNNPAAGILVRERLDVGLGLFSPSREYTVTESQLNGQFGAFSLGEGTVESDSDYFVIPYIAKNWHLSDDKAFTLAFYGRGGMNTDYNSGTATFDPDGPGPAPIGTFEGTYGAGDTGVNLSQAFLELNYSFTVGDWALGIAPIISYQMFEAKGMGAFAPYSRTFAASGGTEFPQNITDNGTDSSFGYGVKVGAIWNATDRLALHTTYQSEIQMDEFDDYSDLFAQEGGFDIPATVRAGASYKATDRFTVHFDVERTYYSDVGSVGNPLTDVVGCPTAGQGGLDIEACAGGERGFGFGWDDITVYQFGVEYRPTGDNGIVWRAGYNYGEQPIADENVLVNIAAPATVEQHFTMGLCFDLSNGDHLSFAVMHAPRKNVTGTNLFDPTQEIELSMSQWEFEVAYTFW